MKRIGISILIGVGCSLIAFLFIQIRQNKLKKYTSNKPQYNAELKIKIGNAADNKRSIVTTLSQIKKRIEFNADVSAEQIDKNNFRISVKRISDTVAIKKLASESIELKFLETFLINEIENSLTAVEKELDQRRKQINGSSDSSGKYDFLLEDVDIETKKKNGTCRLNQLISFFSAFQDPNGRLRYAAVLGTVKTRDTFYLNNILNEENIRNKFPPDLAFVYGKQNDNSKDKDSALNIYAIKLIDPKLYPFPTNDNVESCELDFEPLTGKPIIRMKFDVEGSNFWYVMTKRNVGKPIAMLANDFVLAAPAPEEAISGGDSRIAGDFTVEEVMNLTAMIRSGRLTLPVKIIESKFTASKKNLYSFWMFCLLFLLSSLLAYGISFLIKPVSKP